MKYKVLMLSMAFLILLSSFASAQLDIGDIHVISNGKEEILSENEKIYVNLGSTIRIKVRFENDYTEDDDIEVDIEMGGTIDDIDDGGALDETTDINLNPTEYEHLFLEFIIPRITDSDDYYLDFEIDAKDENGINYNIDRRHKIEIRKAEHEVRLDELKLNKNSISCDSSIGVSFDILNTGMSHEDDLKYTIKNGELGMNFLEIDRYIEEGEIINVDEMVNINKDAPAGEYEIVVEAFCNEERSSVRKAIIITKEACSTSSPQVNQPQQTTQQTNTLSQSTTTPQTTQSSSSTSQVVRTTSNTYVQENKESPLKNILIINGAIIGIGAVLYLVGSAIIKRK